MDNKTIINHFKIFVTGNKISFRSSQPVAKEIGTTMKADSEFTRNLQLYYGDYPTIKTTIHCKAMASIDSFLAIESVRQVFEQEINKNILKPIR